MLTGPILLLAFCLIVAAWTWCYPIVPRVGTIAEYVPEEKWTWELSADRRFVTGTVTGRTPKRWQYKVNPYWWLWNEPEQDPTQFDWFVAFHPVAPRWWPLGYRRYLGFRWWLRNPCVNFGLYVVGVTDRNLTAHGRVVLVPPERGPPPISFANTPDDLEPPELGWMVSIIRLKWMRLPYVAYSGKAFMFYAGWQPAGFFGLKCNLRG